MSDQVAEGWRRFLLFFFAPPPSLHAQWAGSLEKRRREANRKRCSRQTCRFSPVKNAADSPNCVCVGVGGRGEEGCGTFRVRKK